jgi:four helix bundle protein
LLILLGRGGGTRHAPDRRMTPKELKDRTKRFAVGIVRLCRELPTTVDGKTVGHQMIRSGTSVGANYRASCRARSRAEWIAKLGVVEEEADETLFWLEVAVEANLVSGNRAQALLKEADELTAIFVSSLKSAKTSNQQIIRNPLDPRSEI